MRIEFKALGTSFLINTKKNPKSENLKPDILHIVQEFEEKFSRFRDKSLVSRLNNGEIIRDTELFQLLNLTEQIKLLTLGNFNISVGGVLESLGYNKEYTFQTTQTKFNIKYELFQTIDTEKGVKLKPGVRVDLGGIGKGYLIDKLTRYISEHGVENFYLNAGGDIFCYDLGGSGEFFELLDPKNNKKSLGKVKLYNLALAASSSFYRNWSDPENHNQYSHLIRLKKTSSKKTKIGVFVIAKKAAIADALATSLYVCPDSENQEIANNFRVEYLILYEDYTYQKSIGFDLEIH